MTTGPKRKSAKAKRAPKENGRPPHAPTDESKAQVQALCGFGLGEEAVADYLDISVPTLRKHYSDRIRKARPTLMAMASGGLFEALRKKEAWAVKYLHGTLGKKYGWTERTEVVFPTDVFGNCDPSKLTAKEWQLFVDLLLKMGVDLMDTGGAAPMRSEPTLIGSSNGID